MVAALPFGSTEIRNSDLGFDAVMGKKQTG